MRNSLFKLALEEIVHRIKHADLSISDRDLLLEVKNTAQLALDKVAIALQNQATQSQIPAVTTVEWDEDKKAFAVACNGEVIEWFPTRFKAECFANEHDYLRHTNSSKGNSINEDYHAEGKQC